MGKDRSKILTGITDAILASCAYNGGTPAWDAAGPATFPMVHLGLNPDEALKLKVSEITWPEIGGGKIHAGVEFDCMLEGIELNLADLSTIEKLLRSQNVRATLLSAAERTDIYDCRIELILEQNLDTKGLRRFKVRLQRYGDTGSSSSSINMGGALASNELEAQYRTVVTKMRRVNLGLCAYPYMFQFGDTTKLYDAGPSRLIGTLNNGPVQSGYGLRFDGINDYCDFGNVLNLGAADSLVLEAWIQIKAANGTDNYILGKKNGLTTDAGYFFYRGSSNKVVAQVADGTNLGSSSSTTDLLQNTWAHIGIVIDRSQQKLYIYRNGAADNGAGVSISSVGSPSNALNFQTRTAGGGYGNFDLGALRVYSFPAAGPNAAVAAMLLRHFTLERSIFGV